MPKKFKNKYRIASHRKPRCRDARPCVSTTDISNEIIRFGKIVEQEWFKSFEIRKELFLHEFVIMPNHLHAIVEICNENRSDTNNVDINDVNVNIHYVETHGCVSLRNVGRYV